MLKHLTMLAIIFLLGATLGSFAFWLALPAHVPALIGLGALLGGSGAVGVALSDARQRGESLW